HFFQVRALLLINLPLAICFFACLSPASTILPNYTTGTLMNSKTVCFSLAAFVVFVSIASALHAQEVAPPRKHVGVALSGGSALGLAHIGVLKYLEEHRIPVDAVAGTSMGALTRGLYATGHDAA